MATPDLHAIPKAHAINEVTWAKRVAAALTAAGYKNVRVEFPVKNGRVDIQCDGLSIEVDWGHKWAESLGQALYYAIRTNSRAVSLLMIESDLGRVHADNARFVGSRNRKRVAVWVLDTRTGDLTIGKRVIKVQ